MTTSRPIGKQVVTGLLCFIITKLPNKFEQTELQNRWDHDWMNPVRDRNFWVE